MARQPMGRRGSQQHSVGRADSAGRPRARRLRAVVAGAEPGRHRQAPAGSHRPPHRPALRVRERDLHHYGYSFADIERAGGRYWHIATGSHELDRELAEQSVDMVIGHAATTPPWKSVADAGFHFAPLEMAIVEALEGVGFERKMVPPGTHSWISEPYLTLDLSDQPIVSRAEVPDEVIYEIAKSIDLNKKTMAEGGRGQTGGDQPGSGRRSSCRCTRRRAPHREAGYIP